MHLLELPWQLLKYSNLGSSQHSITFSITEQKELIHRKGRITPLIVPQCRQIGTFSPCTQSRVVLSSSLKWNPLICHLNV